MTIKYQTIYEVIGKNIKKYRSEKTWTQQDLADRCIGVTRAKISKMETAYEDFMMSTLLEVCHALGKSLEEIAKEESSK